MNKEEYILALEKERRKILVFHGELPLCLDLVTRTIESLKQGLSCSDTINAESSEQTSSEGRVLEEFIPVKRVSDCAQEQGDCKEDVNSIKSDWLKLGNQNPDPDSNSKLSSPRKVAIVELQRNKSAFHPFNNTSSAKDSTPPPPPTSKSKAETGGSKRKHDKESQRKVRRRWTADLHEKFLRALQKLGGSQTATPKQIREIMQLDDLTNDEVKSHLQKYRLHTRGTGSSSTILATAASSAVTEARPQYVGVGIERLLVQPEFTAMGGSRTTTTAATAEETSPEIYATVAKHPHPFGES